MKRFLPLVLLLASGFAWGATSTTTHCLGTNPCDPTATTPPPPSSSTVISTAAIYFDSNAATDGSGTLASPYKVLSHVNDVTRPDGTDIWLKTGSVFDLQTLPRPAWNGVVVNGSVEDPLIIGTYYVSGGVAYVNTPSNFTASARPATYVYSNGPRAIIAGAYKDSCRNSTAYGGLTNKCPWYFSATYKTDNPNTPVPATTYAAMVNLDGVKGAVLQDIEIKESSGYGVALGSNPKTWCLTGNETCANYSIVQRNKIHHIALNGVGAGYSRKSVIRFNEFYLTNLCVADGLCQNGLPGPAGGSVVSITGCYDCQILVEGNDMYYSWGEDSGPYGVDTVLFRGNRSASGRVGMNSGTGSNYVFEQNMVVGGTIVDPAVDALGGSPASGGPPFWSLSFEGGAGPNVVNYGTGVGGVPGQNILRRNNMAANPTQKCLHTYLNAASNAATRDDIQDVGNLCIVDGGTANAYGPSYNIYQRLELVTQIVNKNNLYVSGAASCDTTNKGSGLVVMDYNLWTTLQTSSVCRGAHDKVGASGLGSFNFAGAKWTSMPSPSDFQPSGGVGLNAGTALTTTLSQLSNSRWDWVFSQLMWLPPGASAQVSRANWNKLLATDFFGNLRNATAPDIGPIEHN